MSVPIDLKNIPGTWYVCNEIERDNKRTISTDYLFSSEAPPVRNTASWDKGKKKPRWHVYIVERTQNFPDIVKVFDISNHRNRVFFRTWFAIVHLLASLRSDLRAETGRKLRRTKPRNRTDKFAHFFCLSVSYRTPFFRNTNVIGTGGTNFILKRARSAQFSAPCPNSFMVVLATLINAETNLREELLKWDGVYRMLV